MLDEIIPVLKNFRDKIYHKIYQLFPSGQDAAMDLVDSSSSNTSATSVVELSLNSLHRRNYCSITRVIDEFYSPIDLSKNQQQNKEATRILSEPCITRSVRQFHLFAVDITPGPRVFSPTLTDRGYVYSPNNSIAGNKPITVGHQYSIAAYLPEKASALSSPWVVPLSCERIKTDQKGITVILMRGDGYREAMAGTVSLYNKGGERLHTIYLGASPEYGKAKFLERHPNHPKKPRVDNLAIYRSNVSTI